MLVHFFNILLFVTALLVGWALFFSWLAVVLVRGVWRGVARITGLTPRPVSMQTRLCTRVRCGHANPVYARFCKRCGAPL